MNNQIVVGIDIAMEKHQYQICDTKTVYSKGAIQNNIAGGNKLLAKIKGATKGKEVVVGMEATNNYQANEPKISQFKRIMQVLVKS